MGAFRLFVESDFPDWILKEFNVAAPQQMAHAKPWHAKKAEILQMWKSLQPTMPIQITPISDMSGGSTYSQDGIRITGSWQFINSVLARLKEIMAYESPQTKLRLVFRGVDASQTGVTVRPSYVFYMNVETKRPKKPKAAPILGQ